MTMPLQLLDALSTCHALAGECIHDGTRGFITASNRFASRFHPENTPDSVPNPRIE